MDILKSFYKKIPKNIWICFTSGVLFGIIIHLYMLTHKLPNWDDLNNLRGFGSGAEYGRWLLEYIRPLAGEWSIPAFNGMLSIIIWSVAACYIYLAMDMRTVTSAILTPLMILSFPSIASTMTYMFTVICYAVGILFVCLGVYLYRKNKYGCIPAIVLFIMSLGIYQSFICLAIGMLIMGFVIDLLQEENSFLEVFKNGIKAVVTLVATFAGYLLISKSFSSNLTSDRGIDTMGQIQITHLPRLVMRSYKRILEYFITKPYSFTSAFTQAVNIAVCIMIVALFLWIIWEKKIYKDRAKTILAMLLMLIEPMALASIYIMAPETQDATLMMLHQYCFVYVIALILMEQIDRSKENDAINKRKGIISKTLYGITAIIIILVGYRYYLVTNEAYFRTSLAFDRAYAYYNRIMMNIESQEGYQYGDQISILGEFYPNPTSVSEPSYDAERFEEFTGISMENGLLTGGSRKGFLQIYLGINYKEVMPQENDEIQATSIYKNMPLYPTEGSIQKINNIWVVKLHGEE